MPLTCSSFTGHQHTPSPSHSSPGASLLSKGLKVVSEHLIAITHDDCRNDDHTVPFTLAGQLLCSSLGTRINYQLTDICKKRRWMDSKEVILSANLDTKPQKLSVCVMKPMGLTKKCSRGKYQNRVNLRYLIKTG